jgi:Flp pilus assembly protein TadD
MSKPMLVTLPFILLLLDYWPLRRLALPALRFSSTPPLRLLLEKLPFLVLSGASCLLTLWAQKAGGAVVPVAVLAIPQRLANALVAYAGYLEKTFWPAPLTILYPLGGDVSTGALILAGAVLAAVTAWVMWSFRSRPHLAVGWFWFLGMLVPVIGLVQVGLQRMADRYTYLPLIGVFVMVAWEVPERTAKWLPPRVLAAVASLVLVACIAATSRELSYWQDSERLFAHALEVTPANYIALENYGRALLKRGKLPEAIRSFSAAVALAPDLDPARCGLGTALMEEGKYDEAADQFALVLQLQPDHLVAQLQLGMIRGRQGRLAEAAEVFARVLRLHPDDAGAHNNLGNVLALQGKQEEAVKQFEETVRLKPDHAVARNNLAISCKKLGRIGEAITHYREALRLQPDFLEPLNNLAWLLATHPDARFRNGAEAVGLATRACELTKYQNPTPLTTLAAAYAETGRFPEAVSFAEQARELARSGQAPLAARLSAMIEAFRAGRPYHAE